MSKYREIAPTLFYLTIFATILWVETSRAEVTADIGVTVSAYEDAATENAYYGRVGYGKLPFFLSARYEAPRLRMLGQPLADSDLFSVGVGFETLLTNNLYVFAEGGYAFIDAQSNFEIRQEVVYTQLVNNHLNPNRPIPILAYPRYDTTYEVDNGLYGRIGLEYRWKSLSITAAYRPLKLDQEYTMRAWEQDLPALREKYGDYANGYWREDTELDLSGFEIGIGWKF